MPAMNPTVLIAVPLLPLLAAVIAGLGGRLIGRAGAHTVTCAAVAISPLRLRGDNDEDHQGADSCARGVRKPPPSCSRSAAPGGLWQAMASAISAHVALG